VVPWGYPFSLLPDPTPEIAHLGEYGSALYMPVLTEKAKELGVDIRYEMPAVQLIKRKSDKKRKLYNGRIQCTYYQFFGIGESL
jgi:hypothetical protein